MEQQFFPLTQKEAERANTPYSSAENRAAGFPSRLRQLRDDAKISQQKLADEIGVTKSTIGLYETGDNVPDARTIYKLAKFYHVTSDYLLGLTNDPSTNPSAVDDLGLLPAAIDLLKDTSYLPVYGFTAAMLVNNILMNPSYQKFCFYMAKSLVENLSNRYIPQNPDSFSKKSDPETAELVSRIAAKGLTTIHPDDARAFYLSRATNVLADICEDLADSSVVAFKEFLRTEAKKSKERSEPNADKK